MLKQLPLITCLCLSHLDMEKPSADFIDIIIAGCDANAMLIDCGWAEYDITITSVDPSTMPLPPHIKPKKLTHHDKNARPKLRKTQHHVRIVFDRKRSRWNFGRIRCYRDEKHDVYFNSRKLQEGEEKNVSLNKAVNYRVTIHAIHTSPFKPTAYHPRYIGHGVYGKERDRTIAEMLRSVLSHPSDWRVKVTPEDELLKVVFDSKADPFRAIYWVSPAKGYSPVRGERYSLNVSKETPASEFQADYKKMECGAYVASHILEIKRMPIKGKYLERKRTETTLNEIALGEKPKDEIFSLLGLGIPRGALVRDKTTGKEYLYDVKKVKEQDINQSLAKIAQVTDPDPAKRPSRRQREGHRTRNLILLTLSGTCFLLIIVLLWFRWHRRTAGSSS